MSVRKFYLAIFGVIAFVLPSFVHASFNATPDTLGLDMFNYVNSILATSTYAFVGVDGVTPTYSTNFPKITSNGLVLSLANHVVSSTTAVIGDFSSSVTYAISDGVGGFYVAGTFTTVGGATHTRIAHLLPDQSVDSSFTGSVTGGTIVAMALSSDRTTLYIGGSFTTVNGVSRASIAALNASTGATVSAFSPTFTGSGVSSFALTSDNSTLYTGGTFTVIGGQNRTNIAALNTSDGTAVAAFNPGASSTVSALALNSSGSTLYAAGAFTGLAGVARNHAGAVSTSNGALQSFNPTTFTTGTITSIALTSDESKLYVGGSFTAIGGQSRNRIAALNISDGTATSFNPNAQNGTVSQIILSADEATLYVGGSFTNIGGITSWNSLGFINTSDGTGIDNSWFARNNGNANVIALSSDGNSLFAGGGFTISGGLSIGPFKFFPATGEFDSTFTAHTDDMIDAMALSPDGNTLYIGGQFDQINWVTHSPLAAVNASTGALINSFAPTVNGDVYQTVLSHDGSVLYISGRFTSVNSVTRNHIAALNTSDGSLVSGFDPNADAFVPTMIMTADGSKLYIGGDFLNVGGVGRSHIAEINTSDGSLISGFNPGTTGNVRSLILSPDESILYMSGNFTQIAGVNRGKIGAVNTSDGSLVSAFNPNANALVRTILMYPDGTGSTLWATGQFTTIGGGSRTGLASLKTSDGTLNAFAQTSPIIDSGVGIAITPDLAQLIVGNGINSAGVEYLQVFTDPSIVSTTPPTVTASAASSITDTSATLNGNITATGGASPTVRGFVYGTSVSYGATTTETGSFSTGAYTGSVSSLTCNTTYHFKAYATNTAGSGYGSDTTFTTSACSSGGGGGGGGGGSSGVVLSAGQGGKHNIPITLPPATTTIIISNPNINFAVPNPLLVPPSTTSQAPAKSNAPIALSNAPGQQKKTAKVVVPPPTSVTGTSTDPTHITISWSPSDGTDIVYEIKRDGVAIGTTTSTTYTDATVSPDTTYTYTVSATDSKGNTSKESEPTTATTPPEVPIVLIEEPTTTESTSSPSVIASIIAFIEESFGSVGEAVVSGGREVAVFMSPIIIASDAMTGAVSKVVPGAGRVLPAVVPIMPALMVITSQFADVFAAGVPLSEGLSAYLSHLVDIILSFFGVRRRKNQLGTIFDSSTGSPIPLAYVTLHNALTGERVSVSVSDAAGAYGFLIKPGRYIMRVAKSGFAFPSRENLSLSFAGVYDNVYKGEVIEVVDESTVVGRNIGMDRIRESSPRYFSRIGKQAYSLIAALIFFLGFISCLHSLYLRPSVVSILLVIAYAVVFALSLFHTRQWGRVYDRRTGRLLQGLLIELYTSGFGEKVVDRAVSDARGRFFIHSPRGKYIVKVYNFGHPAPALTSEVNINKNGVVNNDFALSL